MSFCVILIRVTKRSTHYITTGPSEITKFQRIKKEEERKQLQLELLGQPTNWQTVAMQADKNLNTSRALDKVRATECVINGEGVCCSYYLSLSASPAVQWPGIITNGGENSAMRCKFPFCSLMNGGVSAESEALTRGIHQDLTWQAWKD